MSQIPELMGGRALSHGIAMMVDHGGTGKARMHVGGQAATKTAASAALTDTTDETAFDSLVIPANSLVAGSTIRVKAMGTVTAKTSSPEMIARLRLGEASVALASRELICANGATAVQVGDTFYFDAVIQVRTIGASGTAVGMVQFKNTDTASMNFQSTLKASFTLNTQVRNTLSVTGQWSAASASNSCRSDIFVVDIVNPST